MRLAELLYLYSTDMNRAFITAGHKILSVSIRLPFMQGALALSSMRCRSCVVISHVAVLSCPIGHSSADVIPSRWKINNFAAVNYKLRGSNAFSDHACF